MFYALNVYTIIKVPANEWSYLNFPLGKITLRSKVIYVSVGVPMFMFQYSRTPSDE